MIVTESTPKKRLGTLIRCILLPLVLGGATLALIAKTETKDWEITVDPTFINLAESLLVVGAQDRSVRLRVAAKPSTIENRGALTVTCRFDLSGLGEGLHSLPVQTSEISLPKGVALIEPITPALTIRLEKKISKTVDIVAELEGEPSPGVAVAAVRLKPDRIRLTGTAAMLQGMDTIKTRPISLKGASESFKKEIPLNLPEAIVVASASRLVVAEVDIRKRLITKLFEDIPIKAKGKTTGYRIQPEGITLTISGPEEIVSKIESNPDFSVTIDLEGLAPGDYSLKAAIKLPLHTTLDQVAPELFSVTISN